MLASALIAYTAKLLTGGDNAAIPGALTQLELAKALLVGPAEATDEAN